jgi:hypothetical protein
MHVIKEMTAVFLRVNNYIWCILIYIYIYKTKYLIHTIRDQTQNAVIVLVDIR